MGSSSVPPNFLISIKMLLSLKIARHLWLHSYFLNASTKSYSSKYKFLSHVSPLPPTYQSLNPNALYLAISDLFFYLGPFFSIFLTSLPCGCPLESICIIPWHTSEIFYAISKHSIVCRGLLLLQHAPVIQSLSLPVFYLKALYNFSWIHSTI